MDKDGAALPAWPALGFGFVEVGTVTAHAPAGQPPAPAVPAAAPARRWSTGWASTTPAPPRSPPGWRRCRARSAVPLGISLGKSKVTPLDEAVEDYLASYRALREHGDYFAVNVSSPNTPGPARRCRTGRTWTRCSAALVGEKPVLVKIAPDLTERGDRRAAGGLPGPGRGRGDRHQHHAGRDGLAPADAARGARRAGCPAGR